MKKCLTVCLGLALALSGCGRKQQSASFGEAGSGPVAMSAAPGDWPQWRGPDRTDVSRETGLLTTWPKEGPRLLWTFDRAGIGYSGPAIVAGKLYTLGARGDTEYVLAIDSKTGQELWSTKIEPVFSNGWGDGPRSTPTVDGDLLVALGAGGELVCVETAAGKIRWQVNLQKDLGGHMMTSWGYTESPLVDGDQVVCTPGGGQGTFAALDKKTGRLLWRSKELTDPAAYSSMIVAEVGGVRQYINMTGRGVAGVAADDGRLLWHSPLGANGTAIVPTPIFYADHVYVTSGYGAGCGLLKLGPDGKSTTAEEIYANKTLKNHHGGVVQLGDYVYGYSDGEGWVCQDMRTGKNVWEEKNKLEKGSLTCADGRLYCYGENNGTVVLIEATPEGWKECGRFQIPRQTDKPRKLGHIWTHPVVAGGRLYLRDQDLIFCYDVREGNAR
jgi:outer membrane protein assembly factor BamB